MTSDKLSCPDSSAILCYFHYSHKNVLMGHGQIKFIIIQRQDKRTTAILGKPKVENCIDNKRCKGFEISWADTFT